MRPKIRRGKDKRIVGIIVIGEKKYSIRLTVFPKAGNIVELMNNVYVVSKMKFKELKKGMIPIIYLEKASDSQKINKK